jgi:cadmium resistance protein CadD (predicted permease)
MNEVSSLLGSSLLVPIATAATAFTATNLDDIIILLLLFSQLGERLKAVHVVGGQFLGFTLLVLASLAGFVGSLLIPEEWIGLLGLLPISIGISRLIEVLQGGDGGEEFQANPSEREGFWRSWPLAEVFSVAAVTVANGGDNIGIYLPLFPTRPRQSWW